MVAFELIAPREEVRVRVAGGGGDRDARAMSLAYECVYETAEVWLLFMDPALLRIEEELRWLEKLCVEEALLRTMAGTKEA